MTFMRKECLVSIVLLLGSGLAVAGPSGWDWVSYNGHEYALTNDYNSWLGAEQEAVSAGGHLVTVNDAAENTWLAQTYYDSFNQSAATAMQNAVWIGLYYTGSGARGDYVNSWEWISGDASSYRASVYGSRTSGNADHMYLHCWTHPWRTTWNYNLIHDISPTYHFKGVIELAPSGIPAPGAILLAALGTGLVGWMRRRRTL